MDIIQEAKEVLNVKDWAAYIEDFGSDEIHSLHNLISRLVDRLECRNNQLPIVQLDKYYPKLKNESYVAVFISDNGFERIEKITGGYMVPIIAINPLPPVGDK